LEDNKIFNVEVLGEEDSLLLKAKSHFKDPEDKKEYLPGMIWMKKGPCDYIPPISVDIIERRKSFPLDKNEGIYVRNKKNGKVKQIKGQTYMLTENEELWSKELPPNVEILISEGIDQIVVDKISSIKQKKRDKTRVVSFKTAKGTAVQLHNFKTKETRIVFGPE